MKRIFLFILTLVLVFSSLAVFAGCGNNDPKDTDENGNKPVTVKIGVVGSSEKEIWDYITKELKKENINIEIVTYSTYPMPNKALNDKEIDLNAFQHYAYFETEKQQHGYKLVSIGDTFISAMNIYSKKANGQNKYNSVEELPNGAEIAIPNDPTNGGRALKILQAAGLIQLREGSGDQPTKNDIVANPKNIKITEMDAGSLYRTLPDVDAAVINCNYALDNGLVPIEDGIFQDNVSYYSGKSYVNLIAVHEDNKDNPVFKRVVEVYQSQAIKDIYKNSFKGAYVPAWETSNEG